MLGPGRRVTGSCYWEEKCPEAARPSWEAQERPGHGFRQPGLPGQAWGRAGGRLANRPSPLRSTRWCEMRLQTQRRLQITGLALPTAK